MSYKFMHGFGGYWPWMFRVGLRVSAVWYLALYGVTLPASPVWRQGAVSAQQDGCVDTGEPHLHRFALRQLATQPRKSRSPV